jgi:dihydrofolate synthase/folylpolyglutamate synthase
MTALMKALDNPQADLRCVHVAGTNGKGSVVAMASSCLQACGYAVGTYTSPHLADIRERICINDQVISHPAFVSLLSEVARAVESLPKRLDAPTFFELVTALGFLRFAEQAVDVAVIEVGMGGRLDSTNVITPDVSVVTSISLDHTHFLGDTVGAIAREKAGIFKPGIPALTHEQDKEAIEAMSAVAAAVGAPFEVVGKDVEFSYRFESNPNMGPHTRVGLSGDKLNFEHLPVPLKGEHQAFNCGLALAALDKLAVRGLEIDVRKATEGLGRTRHPGRMELIASQPRILVDGAHNPAAISSLIRSVGAHVPYDSMVMVFGCAADKDVDELLRRVALGADKVIFTKSKNNPRAMEPAELSRRFYEISGKMNQVAPTLDEAMGIAIRAAGRDDLVVITGSFYLVGEAKKLVASRNDRSGGDQS